MKKFTCWLLGHKWHPISSTEYIDGILTCKRCGESRHEPSLLSEYNRVN